MAKAQYAIMRFAKYKGPEIGRIEAHDERTKEKCPSNPDVDTSRTHLNFHIVEPAARYRTEAERQIAEAGCRTRKDSVRVVETLITASPSFFKDMQQTEVRAFFERAVAFIKSRQEPCTILSAVVHMDEKTPHMHLSFVPLTKDGRLSAKEIIGNRQSLVRWQDDFWQYMVKKYPSLERGESASETGRDHIPPRVFKEAAHLNKLRAQLMQRLDEINPLNAKKKSAEIEALLDEYVPAVESMKTQLKKYEGAYRQLKADNAQLQQQVDDGKPSILEQLETAHKMREYESLMQIVDNIPEEILDAYKPKAAPVQAHQRKREEERDG